MPDKKTFGDYFNPDGTVALPGSGTETPAVPDPGSKPRLAELFVRNLEVDEARELYAEATDAEIDRRVRDLAEKHGVDPTKVAEQMETASALRSLVISIVGGTPPGPGRRANNRENKRLLWEVAMLRADGHGVEETFDLLADIHLGVGGDEPSAEAHARKPAALRKAYFRMTEKGWSLDDIPPDLLPPPYAMTTDELDDRLATLRPKGRK